MHIGALIIGDEILSGKRRDKHQAFLTGALAQRGMELAWVRIVGDDPDLLSRSFRETLSGNDLVLSFGGIGATPDDRTRQCLAAAAGVEISRHPEAVAILETRFGPDAYPNRIRMAELPQGSRLIPNPVNQVPGFSLGHHHCVPGFPSMAWPMVEWVLDTHYPQLQGQVPRIQRLWQLKGTHESELIPMMEELLTRFPGVRLSSLPSTTKRQEIELGLSGIEEPMEAAARWLEAFLEEQGVAWETREHSGTDELP
ncbi:MAG TPA: molybdopterin-binding protein [Thioalkalivibrio sp.]|nr:molybdopterin-binding protein [Thioalkalivibrio sp.]